MTPIASLLEALRLCAEWQGECGACGNRIDVCDADDAKESDPDCPGCPGPAARRALAAWQGRKPLREDANLRAMVEQATILHHWTSAKLVPALLRVFEDWLRGPAAPTGESTKGTTT